MMPDKYMIIPKGVSMKESVDHATHLVAFHDGISTGTQDMIDYSNKLGLKVRKVKYYEV